LRYIQLMGAFHKLFFLTSDFNLAIHAEIVYYISSKAITAFPQKLDRHGCAFVICAAEPYGIFGTRVLAHCHFTEDNFR
jgi:hypothetical protein